MRRVVQWWTTGAVDAVKSEAKEQREERRDSSRQLISVYSTRNTDGIRTTPPGRMTSWRSRADDRNPATELRSVEEPIGTASDERKGGRSSRVGGR